jgi:DNA invertase Pin-like site-specific DNA recombinase
MPDPLDRLRDGERPCHVAADLGIRRRTLRNRARKAGVPPHEPGRPVIFDQTKIRGLYQDLGTYAKVADVIGCSVTTVRRAVMGRR